MASNYNLDDPNYSVFFIPYAGEDVDGDDSSETIPDIDGHTHEPDIDDGKLLRWEAYCAAWAKCLDQVNSIIVDLHAPVITSVAQTVRMAYTDVLPGLPFAELPVITLTNLAINPSFLDEVATELERHEDDDDDDDDDQERTAYVARIYPSDCPNLMTGMTSLITSFVETGVNKRRAKKNTSTSAANYDIKLLEAWYASVREVRENSDDPPPNLVVLLHDFEQFDPAVIQDLFEICSLHIPRLPLIFVLALSSPQTSPSFLHLTYPRSTLSLLHVHRFAIPSGMKVLEEIIFKTFFSTDFEPDVVLGPQTLEFLADFFLRHTPSLDSTVNILHLAHLKHFATDPLTLLMHATPSKAMKAILSRGSSFHFSETLLFRLHAHNMLSPDQPSDGWEIKNIRSLVDAVDGARTAFRLRARRMRFGFETLHFVNEFLRKRGHSDREDVASVKNAIKMLKGKLGPDVEKIGALVGRLAVKDLTVLLGRLLTHFDEVEPLVLEEEEDARAQITRYRDLLTGADDENFAAHAIAIRTWLTEYLNTLLAKLETVPLWEVWYTGSSPFPVEIINPSIHATIVSGLLRPQSFASLDDKSIDEDALSELPDSSILFHRYLDSGKMINVYDWFESFKVVLEEQRKQLKQKSRGSPRKSSPRKGKGKEKKEANGYTPMSAEKWRMQVQARFMRAMQELDYIGLIKHTGRKPDHVLRTIFDKSD